MARRRTRLTLASAAEYLQNVRWFGTRGVVGVRGSISHSAVTIDYVRGRNREFPAFVSVDDRQIDEGTAVYDLLVVGNPVDESELAGELVAGIAQERESELMLVEHEERLLDGLR